MQYTARIIVDGRINVKVDANSHDEAKTKALQAFFESDLKDLEVVDGEVAIIEDDNGECQIY